MCYEITFSDIAVIGDKAYASANEMNALIKIDIMTNETEFISKCNEQPVYEKQHKKIIQCGDWLLLLPYFAEYGCIDIYSLTKKIWRRCQFWIPKSREEYTMFVEYIVYKNKLGIFPRNAKIPAVIVDIDNGDVRKVKNWTKIVSKIEHTLDLFLSCVLFNGTVIMPIREQPLVLSVDMEQEVCSVNKDELYLKKQFMCSLDRDMYFTVKGMPHICKRTGEKVFTIQGETDVGDVGDTKVAYCRLFCAQDTIFAIPLCSNEIYFVNSNSQQLKKLNWIHSDLVYKSTDYWDANYCIIGTKIYVLSIYSDVALEIDMRYQTVTASDFQRRTINKNIDSLEQHLCKYIQSKEINIEGSVDSITLDIYLKLIQKIDSVDHDSHKGLTGSCIHDKVFNIITS